MSGLIAQYQQGVFSTPVNGTTADATVVLANDNNVRTKHNSHDSDATIHVQSSSLASRPAAGTAQRFWVTTDGLRAYVDSGASWGELAYLPTAGGTVSGNLVVTGNITGADIFAGAGDAHRWVGRSIITSPADGQIALFNAAESGFTSLALGGLTASFPALKVSGAGIVARLADDSANTTVTASRLIGGTDVSGAIAYGFFSDGATPANNAYAVSNVLAGFIGKSSALTAGAVVTAEVYHKQTAANTAGSVISHFAYIDSAHTSETSNIHIASVGSVEATGNGGTTTTLGAYRTQAVIGTGHTVTNLPLIEVRSPSNSGTITNLYGLKIADMTAGGTLNYAINTGVGINQFGPNLAVSIGDAVRVRANSAANGTVEAARIELHMTAASTGSKYGLEVNSYADNSSGAIATQHAIRGTLQTSASGGTITSGSVLSANAAVVPGTTIGSLSMLLVIAPSGGGTVTTLKGLDIGNMGASQFAIVTGTGIVQFGDVLITAASTSSVSGLRIPSGTAPSSPTDGDLWYDGTHLVFRHGGTSTNIV